MRLVLRLLASGALCAIASVQALPNHVAAGSRSPSEPCASAVGHDCDPPTALAFERWGQNLTLLTPADLGAHSNDPSTDVNYQALLACQLISTSPDRDGEQGWFDYMAGAFPGVDLGDHHELFDTAMRLVCPDLGYDRGYDYTGGSDRESDVTEILPDAAPGTPGWHFVNCAGALAVDSCSPQDAELYQQWGERLPYLYYDPEGTYGEGPWIADYQNESITYDEYNRSALELCNEMASAADVNAADDWLQRQEDQFPDFSSASHMLFFYNTLTLVCPEVSLPQEQ